MAKFSSVNDYLAGLDERHRDAVSVYLSAILEVSDELNHRISYNTLFIYCRNKPLCYFNINAKRFYIGFTKGRELQEYIPELSGSTSQVKSIDLPVDPSAANMDMIQRCVLLSLEMEK